MDNMTMVSLRELQQKLDTALVPVSEEGQVSAHELSGVHLSELLDPTPYLSGGELLLTTGMAFENSCKAVPDYVSRLVAKGVKALGFGVGPVFPEIPEAVQKECARQGLELLIVPDEVTFQQITRTYWHLADEGGQAELKRTLGLQTALVREVVRPDGIKAVLRRLGQFVGGWAAYLPATGANAVVWPETAEAYVRKFRQAENRTKQGNANAPLTYEANGQIILKYPVSSGEKSYGHLMVGSPRRLTAADAQVVATVCTLLLMKIRQRESYTAGIATLGAAVVRLLAGGHADAARLLSENVGMGELPARMHVIGIKGDGREDPNDWLRVLPLLERTPNVPVLDSALEETQLRLQEDGILLLLITEKAASSASPRAAANDWCRAATVSAMMSDAVLLHELPAAVDAVRRGLRRAEPGYFSKVGGYDRSRAEEWVATLLEYDRSDLLGTVAAYLRHRGQWEPTSRELGVHRNSVRHRIETAQNLLGVDLGDPDVFAPLWLALRDRVD